MFMVTQFSYFSSRNQRSYIQLKSIPHAQSDNRNRPSAGLACNIHFVSLTAEGRTM
jgi:hypothetical protein